MPIDATIRAGLEALRELCAFLQTPAGQKFVERSLADSAEFKSHIQAAGRWIEARLKVSNG